MGGVLFAAGHAADLQRRNSTDTVGLRRRFRAHRACGDGLHFHLRNLRAAGGNRKRHFQAQMGNRNRGGAVQFGDILFVVRKLNRHSSYHIRPAERNGAELLLPARVVADGAASQRTPLDGVFDTPNRTVFGRRDLQLRGGLFGNAKTRGGLFGLAVAVSALRRNRHSLGVDSCVHDALFAPDAADGLARGNRQILQGGVADDGSQAVRANTFARVRLHGLRGHRLQNVDADIPLRDLRNVNRRGGVQRRDLALRGRVPRRNDRQQGYRQARSSPRRSYT